MSRLFDGVDDQMFYPLSMTAGAFTILILVKIVNTSDTAWLSFIEQETGAGTMITALGRSDTGLIYEFCNGTQTAVALTDSDGWCLVAVTKVAGTTAPINHKLIIGGAATHTAVTNTTGAPSATSTQLRIGGNDDFANILVGAAAVWQGTAVSNVNLESIQTARTTQSIIDLSPTWLVDDGDGLVTDLIGSVDRTSVTGTSASADNPASWVYFGGAAAAGIPSLVMPPLAA